MKRQLHLFNSPKGCTFHNPVTEARRAREPGVKKKPPPMIGARRVPQPRRNTPDNDPFLPGLSDANHHRCSGALRAPIMGWSLYPGLRRASRSSPGVMFVSPSGLGRRLVRIVVCWLFRSDAYLKSMIDNTWKKHIQNENSAKAISQGLSSLNILFPNYRFWQLLGTMELLRNKWNFCIAKYELLSYDEELATIHIKRHSFRPDWNYVIMPEKVSVIS